MQTKHNKSHSPYIRNHAKKETMNRLWFNQIELPKLIYSKLNIQGEQLFQACLQLGLLFFFFLFVMPKKHILVFVVLSWVKRPQQLVLSKKLIFMLKVCCAGAGIISEIDLEHTQNYQKVPALITWLLHEVRSAVLASSCRKCPNDNKL